MELKIRLALVSFLALALSVPVRAAVDDIQFRVVIVAVNDFVDTSSFKDALLDAEILKAGQELCDYFQKNYGVSPDFLHTRTETSSSNLKSWLADYFRTTQKTITLVFILSHGVPVRTTANTVYNSELYLATADATQGTISGLGLRAGAELIHDFRTLPNGSSVFLFIDACEAGSIGSEGLQRDLDSDPDHRIMIVVSSKAKQQSYEARFTRTLQRLWETSPARKCTHEKTDVEDLVTQSMDNFFPITVPVTTKQEVTMIRPFSQDFCFESFAANQALLLVTNPLTNQPISVSWRQDGDLKDSRPEQIDPQKVVPYLFLRREYRIHFTTEDGKSITKPVDLSTSPFAKLFVAQESDSVVVSSNITQQSLDILSRSGVGADDVKAFTAQLSNDLGSENERRKQEAAVVAEQVNKRATQLGAIVQQEAGSEAVVKARQEEAKTTRENASSRCHTVIDGISMLDDHCLLQAIAQTRDAEQSLEEAERQQRDLQTAVAQAELFTSEARVFAATTKKAMEESQAAWSSFESAVRQQDAVASQVQSSQDQFASRLSDDKLRAIRADRGIVIPIPTEQLVSDQSENTRLSPTLISELSSLNKKLLKFVPDAFIEIEAYSETGNRATAQRLADEITSVMREGFKAQDVVARGFGRVRVVVDGQLGSPISSRAQIIVSSPRLGYPSIMVPH